MIENSNAQQSEGHRPQRLKRRLSTDASGKSADNCDDDAMA